MQKIKIFLFFSSLIVFLFLFCSPVKAATMSLSPATGTYNATQQFQVDIIVNTQNVNVNSVTAIIIYDPALFTVSILSCNDATKPSAFYINGSCQEAEASVNNNNNHKIRITRGTAYPNVVNVSNARIATLNITAPSGVIPTQDNFAFDFTSGNPDLSNVFQGAANDSERPYIGTPLLTSVTNGRYTITGGSSDTTPPIISGVSAGAITSNSATISWATNEASDSQVEYGPTASYGSQTTLNSSMVTSHSQSLGGLSASTLYHYRVKSRDAVGNLATGSDNTFTTTGGTDTTPPVISGVSAGAITSNSAAISWTTNEAADSQVEYGTAASYGSQTTLNPSMVTSHSQTISGLSASTLYHYRVKSSDASGNLATGSDNTFTTASGSQTDTTPPNISGGSPSGSLSAGTSQTAMSVSTDESATCRFSSNAGVVYSSMTNNFSSTGGTSHSTTIGNLINGSNYNFYVRCQDASGNSNTSDYTVSFSVGSQPQPPSPVGTLSVALSANPNYGSAPLNGVDLTATVSGNTSGNSNYTFYCNRADTGTNITTSYQGKYDNQAQTNFTAADICNYSSAGNYTAKVIVERGNYQAEARFGITVVSTAPSPAPGPTPAPSPSSTNHRPIGNLDSADSRRVIGWAFDQDANLAPVTIRIFIDNKLTTTIIANVSRPDILGAGSGAVRDSYHGFSYNLPLLSSGSHTIGVSAVDIPTGDSVALGGSPKTINVSGNASGQAGSETSSNTGLISTSNPILKNVFKNPFLLFVILLLVALVILKFAL